MDPSLLITPAFWSDPTPVVAGVFPGELPDDPRLSGQVLFETSGSSGNPKWIALSKLALQASAAAVNRHLDVIASSCWGLVLPLHHVGGFGVAARACQAGCRLEIFDGRWDAASFVSWVADRGVTHTSLVPTQVHDLVAGGHRAPTCVTAIVVGGGCLDERTGGDARALGWPVLASYGMTEACSQIATCKPFSLDIPYLTAPLPLLPIWQVRVGVDQRLRLSGSALFSGYVVREGERWIYQPRTGEWFESADRVAIGEGGLTPLGRADLLVKVLGELLDPEMIEREMMEISNGKLGSGSFVVVALPDARAEHVLVPVFDAGVDTEMVSSVLMEYRRLAPGFRRLREAVFLKSFPRSLLGKPRRAEILREISGA
ncbi:MAG: AMP-binding protein [Verrucomicrobiota bacterium]